jgi:hypothetical protein
VQVHEITRKNFAKKIDVSATLSNYTLYGDRGTCFHAAPTRLCGLDACEGRRSEVRGLKAKKEIAMKSKMMWIVGMAALGGLVGSASATYVTYIGENNDPSAPVGGLIIDANWDGGAVPYGSSTGLVYTTKNVWGGGPWNNAAVRQTGGYLYTPAGQPDMTLRGGVSGSGVTTVYEVEDSRTDYAAYTNLYVSRKLTLWSANAESMEIDLLSGHIVAEELSLNASGKGSINIRDGIFRAAYMSAATANINMLSGGTGDLIIDVVAQGGILGGFYVDFAFDNQGSIYFGEKEGGESIYGLALWLVDAGRVSIDGVTTTDRAKFDITQDGLSATLKVIPQTQTPYVEWVSEYGLTDTNGTAALTADPDNDGRNNLVEYALGGDPTNSAVSGHAVTACICEVSGTNWFESVHFERVDKEARGLSYELERIDDLAQTNWVSTGFVDGGSGAYDAEFNVVTNLVEAEPQIRFVRVSIEQQ